MAKYRVALEHTTTHKAATCDVEADALDNAVATAFQTLDETTSADVWLFDLASIWRLDIPFEAEQDA